MIVMVLKRADIDVSSFGPTSSTAKSEDVTIDSPLLKRRTSLSLWLIPHDPSHWSPPIIAT